MNAAKLLLKCREQKDKEASLVSVSQRTGGRYGNKEHDP